MNLRPEHQALRDTYNTARDTLGEEHPETLTAKINLNRYWLKEGLRLKVSRYFIADCRREIREAKRQLAS